MDLKQNNWQKLHGWILKHERKKLNITLTYVFGCELGKSSFAKILRMKKRTKYAAGIFVFLFSWFFLVL